MSTSATPDLDLVLVGATGFVGRLTAERIARHAPVGLRVGLAGRSPQKLADLRASLGGAASQWPLLTLDLLDESAVADLATRTRVVVTTAGPYLRYGVPLVIACARAGTHYADLTGETLFVRRSIDAAHHRALDSGARIVHSCGFDSIPSDLGVGLAAERAAHDGAGALTAAVLHVRSLRGGVSGGTIDSLRQQILETEDDPALRRLLGDAQALVDEVADRPYGTGRGWRLPVVKDEQSGGWQTPFVMASYNRQIVHRSNALTGWSYGRDLSYREVVDTGRGPLGLVTATGLAVGTGALTAGMAFGPTRQLLGRLLPDPGEGPSERVRKTGRFRMEVRAETTSGSRYGATVAAAHDPGYDGTAVMLAQSGLALAEGAALGPAGVVTPMVALGAVLPGRLRGQGFEVDVEKLS